MSATRPKIAITLVMDHALRLTERALHPEVRTSLYGKGWSPHQVDLAEAMLHESIVSNPAFVRQKPALDQASIDAHISYLRKHPSLAHLQPHYLDQLRETLLQHAH